MPAPEQTSGKTQNERKLPVTFHTETLECVGNFVFVSHTMTPG